MHFSILEIRQHKPICFVGHIANCSVCLNFKHSFFQMIWIFDDYMIISTSKMSGHFCLFPFFRQTRIDPSFRSSWEIAPIKNGLLPPDRFHLQWGYKERRIKKSFTYSCSASPSYQTQGRNFQYREGSGKNRKGNLRGINIAFLLNFIIFTR